MKLNDILESPEYSIILPVSKKEVKYRPFRYKEQRVLLQAQEEKNPENILITIHSLLEYCTFGQVDVKRLDLVDFQYLFLKLREVSSGGNVDLQVKCGFCEHYNEVHTNIEEVKIIYPEVKVDNPIKLNETTYLTLVSPSLQIASLGNDTMQIIKSCMKNIIKGDTVIELSEKPDEEVLELIESMTEIQLNKIKDFLNNSPKLSLPIEFDCSECKKHNSHKFESILELFI